MKCSSCGASLGTNSNVCHYCGSLNDTDLRSLHYYTTNEPETDRNCPRCNKPLNTIDLKLNGSFFIERCNNCLGLFFDPSELEHLLENHVQHVHQVDHKQLNLLVEEQHKEDWGTTYIKCPICQKLMNRQAYGSRSGVIVDTCKNHGIWLDGGELGTLFRWSKAGGRLHDQKRKDERAKEELKDLDFNIEAWEDPRFEESSDENYFLKILEFIFF